MKKKDFIRLVDKYANGVTTPKEAEVVETFFKAHQTKANLPKIDSQNGKTIFKNIQKHLPKERQTFSYKIAAVAAVAFICFLSFHFLNQPSVITHITAKGERKKLTLQDGSVVNLNANSFLSYSSEFKNNRNIKLKGQAFFQVKKGTEFPFIVNTNHLRVEVLGTSFDVNANNYSNPKVSVVSGEVKVSDNRNTNDNLIIHKNEQVVLKDDKLSSVKTDSNIDIAWTKNIIHLQNNTLKETASILENWYDITIDFEDSQLEKLRISGKYKSEKIENIIKSMALLKDLKIDTITTKHILIRKNKN
ncbi:MAG: FecR family protein [Psychroflexus halocasei]